MTKPERPVQMAVIGAAHGIKGEVRVKSFTADPLALGAYGPLYDAAGKSFEVGAIRAQGNAVVVRFRSVSDRSAAEALNGTPLFVDRSVLPEDLDEGEFYHADLIGLVAVTTEGEPLGTVGAVMNFGGGDLLELRRKGGGTTLIPFTAAAVPEVAVRKGILRIDPLAAGLVSDDEEPGPPRDAGGNR